MGHCGSKNDRELQLALIRTIMQMRYPPLETAATGCIMIVKCNTILEYQQTSNAHNLMKNGEIFFSSHNGFQITDLLYELDKYMTKWYEFPNLTETLDYTVCIMKAHWKIDQRTLLPHQLYRECFVTVDGCNKWWSKTGY